MLDEVWREVRACFEDDDGSLPGIELTNLSPSGLAAIYAMLRRRSRPSGGAPEFWDLETNQAMLVDSVERPTDLVVAGQASGFHHCVSCLVSDGVELPELGVSVAQSSIEVDYRMGRNWGVAEVMAFFKLLQDCCRLEPAAIVRPAPVEEMPYPDRFLRAWELFNLEPDPGEKERSR